MPVAAIVAAVGANVCAAGGWPSAVDDWPSTASRWVSGVAAWPVAVAAWGLSACDRVVIASRTGSGRVGRTYAYPGGGRRLHEMGALFAGARRPQQARIDLMLALGAGMSDVAMRALFAP